MIALDLFCGAGGSSMGLKLAGFKKIVGIDIKNQPEYPFEFVKSDVFDFDNCSIKQFDLIWASPPCQGYTWATKKWRNLGKKYPDMIGESRKMLLRTEKPFVIENVVGAPLRRDLMLCGEMFSLRIIRHRIFEIGGFTVAQVKHLPHKNRIWNGTAVGVYTGGYNPAWFGNKKLKQERMKYYVTVAGYGGDGGKGNTTLKAWQEAMEIDWITNKKMLAEAVPPKYSEYIGRQFLENLKKELFK